MIKRGENWTAAQFVPEMNETYWQWQATEIEPIIADPVPLIMIPNGQSGLERLNAFMQQLVAADDHLSSTESSEDVNQMTSEDDAVHAQDQPDRDVESNSEEESEQSDAYEEQPEFQLEEIMKERRENNIQQYMVKMVSQNVVRSKWMTRSKLNKNNALHLLEQWKRSNTSSGRPRRQIKKNTKYFGVNYVQK